MSDMGCVVMELVVAIIEASSGVVAVESVLGLWSCLRESVCTRGECCERERVRGTEKERRGV